MKYFVHAKLEVSGYDEKKEILNKIAHIIPAIETIEEARDRLELALTSGITIKYLAKNENEANQVAFKLNELVIINFCITKAVVEIVRAEIIYHIKTDRV